MTQTLTAPRPPQTSKDPRRWWLLVTLALAQLMVVLDGTVVNIALPQAQLELGMSDGTRTWVVTIYALAFGSLLLVGGRIVDYWGRKRSFMLGMVGFALASAIGGFASTTEMLLVARGLQGVFAALLAPAALAILTVTFPSGSERVKAFAVFGAIGGGGAAVGLLLGGILTQYVSWGWCLLVNVPIAAVAIAAGIPLITEGRAEGSRHLDLPGALLVVAGLASLVYGFAQAENGWTQTTTLVFLSLGVALLAAFVWVESRVSNPLLPLRILKDRSRGGAFAISALTGAAMLGGLLFLIFYFQIVLGYSPLKSGVASLPMTATIMVCAGLLTKALPRIGARLPMTVGPLVAAVGLFWLSFIPVQAAYTTTVLPGLVVLGIGLSMIFIPLQNVALYGVDPHDAGVASATINATQQIGGSTGTALLTAIYTSAVTAYLASNQASPTAQPAALVDGYSHAFTWSAILIACAAPIAYFLIRVPKTALSDNTDTIHLG